MMKVSIPHHTPRDPLAFKGKIDFWKGYRGYIFYASAFLLMAIVIIISCFYPPYERDSILIKAGLWIVVSLGAIFGGFLYVIKKHKERLYAFTHGKIMTWIVAVHGTKFTLLKSTKDYTLSIAIPQGEDFPILIEARKPDKSFHDQYPIKSEIAVIFDKKKKSAFIPAEVDVEIE